ncbi:nitroreductase family protein [bacterium]|nr:nitroreductase family protein [candidate division CSSED10-310 bacterium]
MSIDFIFSRRSIRKYTNEPVSENEIRLLLEAAMAAPSARNMQPWHFVVVTDRKRLDALAEAHPYGKMLAEAPLAIAVIGDPIVSDSYWIQDCSAATENILLAVSAMNLGAVWLGCTPRRERVEAVQHVLSIPEEYPVLSLLAIGHPAEEKSPRTQFDPKKVHREVW